MSKGGHTIVLTQPTKLKSTRTYADYETLSEALDGVCQIYETRLKQENPIRHFLAGKYLGQLSGTSPMTFLTCWPSWTR